MNDDEFQALQQEQEEIRQLEEAIQQAKDAGLDADHIMAESRKGYEGLMKTRLKVPGDDKVLLGNTILNRAGLYSERHGIIRALSNAVRKAKGEPTV